MAEQSPAERPKILRFPKILPAKSQFGERLRMRVVDGPDSGTGFCLLADTLIAGRDESCEISLKDEKASRRHVELTWKNNRYFARDLDSANGLLINGKKIKGAFLEAGDLLTIGNSALEVIGLGKQSQLGAGPAIIVPTKKKDEAQEKLRKNRIMVFAILFLGAMWIFSSSDKVLTFRERAYMSFSDQEKPEKKLTKQEGKEVLKDFVPNSDTDSPGFKQAQRFYREGMRELQNKNYRRAISAFETAQTVDPTHELSRVYIDIAKKRLEEEITYNYLAAENSVSAHRLREAKGYYTTVMRLLEKDPNNQIYLDSKAAMDKIEKLEIKEDK